jgi:hypothetical protein
MHASDPLSTNVFARLFSYTPRSDAREPIEDFCTEALAWCLLDAGEFATQFLDLIKNRLRRAGKLAPNFEKFAGSLDVATQISFTADPNDEDADEEKKPSRSRFDLLIQPQVSRNFVVVIESKVHFDRLIASQLTDYERALMQNLAFHHYPESERYVISLTPWTLAASPNYVRILWQEIHELLCRSASTDHPVIPQFAEFLKSRNLSSLKLVDLKTQQLEQLQQITPFFDDASQLLGRFQNEPKLKSIFKRHSERPVINYEAETNSSWFGIYTGNRNPWVYAGFCLQPAAITLYVQFLVDGDRRSWDKEFPTDLAEAVKHSSRLKRAEMEDRRTCFYFTTPLTPDLLAQPEFAFQWFKTTVESAEDFFQKKINGEKI